MRPPFRVPRLTPRNERATVEVKLTRADIEWLLLFLSRTVPKGQQEEDAAVRLMEKLTAAMKPRRKSTT